MSSGPFPLEIIQRIVYYLTHGWIGLPGQNPPLFGAFRSWGRICGGAPYATVNKAWQVAVERETFAVLRLDRRRLAEADAILNKVPRRQKYVRTIRLNVLCSLGIPGSSFELVGKNNRALQDTFEAFLATLSDWTPGPPVKLCLDAFALTDDGGREVLSQPMHHPMEYAPLELTDPERVLHRGPVYVVTQVDMEGNRLGGRCVSATAVCTLVARLPAAKHVSINWLDASHHYAKARSAFAQALKTVTHGIDYFHIAGAYYHPPDLEQPARTPSQREAEPDELSQSLGIISQRLQSLDLYDVAVSDELFLQHNLPPGMVSPAHWARLENLSLCYPPVMPSGESLFYPDPTVPDRERAATIADPAIQRRYFAAARAALNMPLLRNMLLVADIEYGQSWHKFWYCRNAKGNVPKARWTSSSGFVPEEKVLEAWREVPRKHLGGTEELEVEILNDQNAV